MGAFDQVDMPPRRVMVLFFLVDTSKSMEGSKISAVNTAAREVIPVISEISSKNADAQIKIAVMDFATGTEWVYPQPVEIEKFEWQDLEAGGLTSLGEACTELAAKLSVQAYMQEATGSFAPVIILMSDGEPTDDYKRGLEKLKGNPWFKKATKIAIAIGDNAENQDVLAEFVGNKGESVFTVHNKEQLASLIRFVSVRASDIQSKRSSVGKDAPETKQEEVIEKIHEGLKEDPVLKGVDVGTDVSKSDDSDWGDDAGW